MVTVWTDHLVLLRAVGHNKKAMTKFLFRTYIVQGESTPLTLEIYPPVERELEAGGVSFACKAVIIFGDNIENFEGHGVDEVKALLLTLNMAKIKLDYRSRRMGVQIYYLSPDFGLALPSVPEA